jgi:hypothetical protein
MGEDRQIPGWLRTSLNLLAIFGVLATIMGWVKPIIGLIILLFSVAYVGWEVAPWATPRIRRRPVISLIVFMVIGAGLGAAVWQMWRSIQPATETPVPAQVVWPMPASISAGTPLSGIQLNAVSPVPGVFTYDPPLGTVLPVGIHILTATFYAADSNKYLRHTETTSIKVVPIPPPESPKPSPQNTTKPTDALLVNATKELADCQSFLKQSDVRRHSPYGLGPSLDESETRLNQFPTPTNPQEEAELSKLSSQVHREEGSFISAEMQLWNLDHQAAFGPVYRQIMEAVINNPTEIYRLTQGPVNLDTLHNECSGLANLLPKYSKQIQIRALSTPR